MKTFLAKKETVQPKWHLIDAEGVVLGRLAVKAANLIRGRHKASYTPTVDNGDFVVVINAEKVVLTGKKESDKIYRHHSQYPGGLKERSARSIRAEKPESMIEEAVWGMLPKNRLGRKMLKKLKVYRGANHPHEAQKPERIDVAE